LKKHKSGRSGKKPNQGEASKTPKYEGTRIKPFGTKRLLSGGETGKKIPRPAARGAKQGTKAEKGKANEE